MPHAVAVDPGQTTNAEGVVSLRHTVILGQPATKAPARAQKRVTIEDKPGRPLPKAAYFFTLRALNYFLPCASKWAFTASSACPLP